MAGNKGIGGIIDDILGDDAGGDGRGWYVDPQGHSKAAKSKTHSRNTGSKGGSARHQLSDQDRSKGGKISASKQNMSELGRRGGSK
jgi:general stress protein YciG